jgi:hypothetical protein
VLVYLCKKPCQLTNFNVNNRLNGQLQSIVRRMNMQIKETKKENNTNLRGIYTSIKPIKNRNQLQIIMQCIPRIDK